MKSDKGLESRMDSNSQRQQQATARPCGRDDCPEALSPEAGRSSLIDEQVTVSAPENRELLDLRQRLSTLQTEHERLKESVKNYVAHTMFCARKIWPNEERDCDCGLWKLFPPPSSLRPSDQK